MARRTTKQNNKYLADQGLKVPLPVPLSTEPNKKTSSVLVYTKNIIKNEGGAGGLTCESLASCPVIVTIQGDISNIQSDILALQAATTVEALQDAVSSLLVHGNHSGVTATYDDANNQIILTVSGGGSGFSCADVAVCINTNTATQTALLNWLENTPNVTIHGDRNFDGDVTFTNNNVTFNNSTVDLTNGTTMNYDSTVVSNHNGDTVNYDGSTVNSTNTTYNHTGDDINYDSTTTVDGGTFNNNTFNNPTFTGTITGVVEGVTGNIVDNTDPQNPIVTQVQADWQQTNNTQTDFIKNKSVRPDQLAGSTTNSKIVVRDTNGTFRDATAADITALGIGGFNPTLLGYHQITGGATQSVSIPVPPLTKIINVYGDRVSGDLTGTMFRGGIISTWGDNPSSGVSGVSWNIVANTLSGTLYVPNLQTLTFEFIG